MTTKAFKIIGIGTILKLLICFPTRKGNNYVDSLEEEVSTEFY